MNAPVEISLTPCGRIPGTPLKNERWEIVAQEIVAGKTRQQAGILAGYKDTPQLDGNISRLIRPGSTVCGGQVRERIEELSANSAVLAEVHAGWVLARTKIFADATPACFWKRDDEGNLVLDSKGLPILDFSKATEDDFRTIAEMTPTKFGLRLKVHDPANALEKLGRYLDLWKGSGDTNVNVAQSTVVRLPAPSRDAREWAQQYGPAV